MTSFRVVTNGPCATAGSNPARLSANGITVPSVAATRMTVARDPPTIIASAKSPSQRPTTRKTATPRMTAFVSAILHSLNNRGPPSSTIPCSDRMLLTMMVEV